VKSGQIRGFWGFLGEIGGFMDYITGDPPSPAIPIRVANGGY